MTPVFDRCSLSCVFCWRHKGFDETIPLSREDADNPVQLLNGIIEAQRRLVSGFKGDDRCDENKWEESRMPMHIAISLTGEPTLYPYLSDFIYEARKRGMTTFLVTNGTTPDVLRNLSTLPTQLYVSLTSYNKKSFNDTCVPSNNASWDKIKETIEILPSLNTRKVIRHTLVKGWNMNEIKEYGILDKIASPDFIETKGYAWVGRSRETLAKSNMPSFDEIGEFATKLAEETGYTIADKNKDSKVFLMSSREDTKIQNP